MAALQQLAKLLRRGTAEPVRSADSDAMKPAKRQRAKSRSQDASVYAAAADDPAERDKYWTMPGGMRRSSSSDTTSLEERWSQTGSRRLPPLPTGAPLLPDVSREAWAAETRLLDSPAHIYEEIPYWAVCEEPQQAPFTRHSGLSDSFSNMLFVLTGKADGGRCADVNGDVDTCRDVINDDCNVIKGSRHSYAALNHESREKPNHGTSGSAHLCNIFESGGVEGFGHSPTPSENNVTSASHIRSATRRLLTRLGNNQVHSHLEPAADMGLWPDDVTLPHATYVTEGSVTTDLDTLIIPIHQETDYIGIYKDPPPHQPSNLAHQPSNLPSHHQPSNLPHQPSTLPHQPSNLPHQPSNLPHQPSNLPHQPSNLPHQPSNPTPPHQPSHPPPPHQPSHPTSSHPPISLTTNDPVIGHEHTDSADACYEYDLQDKRKDVSNLIVEPDNTHPLFKSRDQGSFRSHDGSHGRSDGSNATYSEYDLRSDTSSMLDYEGEYESILSKIRDNLRLKEDVLKLVSFSDGPSSSSQSSDTISLTTVSSLSQASIGDAPDTPPNLTTPPKTYKVRNSKSKRKEGTECNHMVNASRASKKSSSKRHGRHGTSNRPTLRFDIDKDLTPDPELAEGKLSCRVSTFVPRDLPVMPRRNGPRRASGTVGSLGASSGQNRLLADLLQKNHDRLSLVVP